MMCPDIIILDNLTIGYSRRNSIREVCGNLYASLPAARLTCLLGCNGVGKSTLMKTLSAFIPPLSGRILLNDRDILGYSPKELSRLLAVVLTDRVSVDNMTVLELVEAGRSPYTGFWGRLTAADRSIVQKALGMVGIDSLQRRMIQTLSDGERQKVMIAKALAQQTPVILLDEPTAFLDFPSKVEIMQLLRTLTRETGKSVFLSTHDVDLALQVADSVWLMSSGEELVTGIPEDLALNGSLGRFFPGREVFFDKAEVTFRIRNRFSDSIPLVGEGELLHMVVRALRRNGIEPVRMTEEGIRTSGISRWIDASDGLLLHTDQGVTGADSVGELLGILGV